MVCLAEGRAGGTGLEGVVSRAACTPGAGAVWTTGGLGGAGVLSRAQGQGDLLRGLPCAAGSGEPLKVRA